MGKLLGKFFLVGSTVVLFTFAAIPHSQAADLVNIFLDEVSQPSVNYNAGSQSQGFSISGKDNVGNSVQLYIIGINREQDANQSSTINYCKNFAMLVFKQPNKFGLSISGQGTVNDNGAENIIDLSDPTNLIQCSILRDL